MERTKDEDEDSQSTSYSSDHDRKRKSVLDPEPSGAKAESEADKKPKKLESEKVSASDATTASEGKVSKRKREDDDQKRMERRRAANRQSARKSTQRQKNLVADLQKNVADLYKQTTELRNSNKDLQAKLEEVTLENQRIKELHQRTEATPNPQFNNQPGMLTEANTTAAIPTIRNLGDILAQNSGGNFVAATVPSSAANVPGMDANELNRIIHQVELGAFRPSNLPQQQGETSSQGAAAHQNPMHMPSIGGQMQPHVISLPVEIAGNLGRIDPNDLRVLQLQQTLRAPPSQTTTTGQNVIVQNQGQPAQLTRLTSGSEVASGRINANDAQVQQILAALQQSNASQQSNPNNEQNRQNQQNRPL